MFFYFASFYYNFDYRLMYDNDLLYTKNIVFLLDSLVGKYLRKKLAKASF